MFGAYQLYKCTIETEISTLNSVEEAGDKLHHIKHAKTTSNYHIIINLIYIIVHVYYYVSGITLTHSCVCFCKCTLMQASSDEFAQSGFTALSVALLAPPTMTTSPGPSPVGGLSTGAIVGIVIAALAVAVLLFLIIVVIIIL